MNYIEYGKDNKNVIILLHGGGLSYWNYREVAERLKGSFRVILPILDGHANSSDNFTSIEENAVRLINFIDENFGGSVLLIGGLSLGGQILLDILSKRKDICEHAIIESACVVPSYFTHYLVKPTFGSCYDLVKQKWFAKLQFKSLKINKNLFDDYYKDSSAISKDNMIAFLKCNSVYSLKESIQYSTANVHVFVGEKEIKRMIKSAKLIHNNFPNSSLEILNNLYHGEFSLNNSELYARIILEILS